MKRTLFHSWVILTVALILGGCINLGPDYHRPDIGVQVPTSYQYGPMEKTIVEPEDQWWRVFNNPELNQLAEQALRNNLDIKRATAAVLEVRGQLVETRADRFPQVGLDGQAERRQSPVVGAIAGENSPSRLNVYTLSLPASFELDLWGRLARAEEGVRANLIQAEENRRTVAQTVVAETISLYLLMESLERQIDITKKRIEWTSMGWEDDEDTVPS